MKIILSLWIWFAGICVTMITFIVSLILSAVLRNNPNKARIIHSQCFWWSDWLVALNPFWKITVKGLENIDPNETYVMVANHQSLADIVVVYKIRTYFKWVAKEELLKVPFIGGLLKINNHIMLARGDFGSIKVAYRQAAEYLRSGISMVFFPEGTRSETDQMGEFQNGAFKLAIREKKKVLPIYIGGCREAIPKGGFIFNSKVVGRLEVLPPIDTSTMQISDFDLLRDRVRNELVKTAAACSKAGH